MYTIITIRNDFEYQKQCSISEHAKNELLRISKQENINKSYSLKTLTLTFTDLLIKRFCDISGFSDL